MRPKVLLALLASLALPASFAVASCGGAKVETLGEVLVIVDTDAPVPKLVGRLRVDFYAPDGTWYESRDIVTRPSDWPLSFGAYSPDPQKGRIGTIRLRAYPEGKVRDYRGERYAARPLSGAPLTLAPEPPATDLPRLLDARGVDITPPAEPQPLLTIDRLLSVDVRPGVRGAVRVVLRTRCFGTMADVEYAQTCVDTENVRVPVTPSPIDPNMTLPSTSLAGTATFDVPCTATPRVAGTEPNGAPLYDEEVCVPGSIFIFGSTRGFGLAENDDLPERVAIVPPFRMDRYEVTVGRWRDAVKSGFTSPDSTPRANEGPIPTTNTDLESPTLCSWSFSLRNREDYAVTCISWLAARAFCQWRGGDLPSEVQWEYAAAVAARPARTRWPWGTDELSPTCERVVGGRDAQVGFNECNLDGMSYGPLPVTARATSSGDVSVGLAIVNLGGGVEELQRDRFASFRWNCWAMAPLASPGCDAPGVGFHTSRGGSWHSFGGMGSSLRSIVEDKTYQGFRCVRGGT